MNRWQPDWIDLLIIAWAEQRRKALGIVLGSQFVARERIGGLNCTLASPGGGDAQVFNTKRQNWPEVYTGSSYHVHVCWSTELSPAWKEVMHVHYVWREIPVRLRAKSIGLPLIEYYQRLNALKPHVDNYVKQAEKVQGIQSLTPRTPRSGSPHSIR